MVAARATVVRAVPEIWERYRAVRLAALRDAPEMFGSTFDREQAFDEAEWRTRAERPATFLVERGGADIGMAGIYEFEAGWCVMGMWLRADARGSGAVDQLIAACVRTAQEYGADRVSLLVMEDNPRGVRAYERNGFRLTGDREPGRDGRWELVMSRPVRDLETSARSSRTPRPPLG